MRGTLTRFLIVGVPGILFLIVGALNAEYVAVALGGFFVVDAVYGLSRKQVIMLSGSDYKQQSRSFVLAAIMGASFAIAGFVSQRYLLAAVGSVILLGALLRFCATAVAKQ